MVRGDVTGSMVVDKLPDEVPYLMSEEEAPVPALHVMVACAFPAVAEIPVGAEGGLEIAAQLPVVLKL